MRRPFFFVVAALVPLLLYARTAGYGFVQADDADLIAGNQAFLTDLGNVPRAFTRSYFEVEGELTAQKTYYRPVAIVSFMLDAARAGADPRAYHLTNVVLHALATCLLLALALAWGAPPWGALAAGLVFAVHPVNVQAVAWIAGRNDLLLALFGLVSLLAWRFAGPELPGLPEDPEHRRDVAGPEVPGRREGPERRRGIAGTEVPSLRRRRRTNAATGNALTGSAATLVAATATTLVAAVVHVVAFALALFSKETGLFFPVLAVLHQRLLRGMNLTRRQQVALAADVAVIAMWLALRASALSGQASELTLASLQVAARNLPQLLLHAGKMLAPVRLNVAPGVDALGMLIGAAAIALFAWLVPRRHAIFAAAWTLAFLLPTLIVPGLPAYEHRAYLPLAGIAAVTAASVTTRQNDNTTKRLAPRHASLLSSLSVCALTLLATIAYGRQPVFHDPFSYWTDAARDPRFGPIAHVNLGQLYEADGRLADARREYLRALARDADTPKAHNDLGVVLMKLDERDLALTHFREETRRHPWNADAWFNLGLFEEQRGDAAAARRHYERAIEANRAYRPAYEKLGLTPPRGQ